MTKENNTALAYLPKDMWWKLFIDKSHHILGPKAYDNDMSQGHYNSMMMALDKYVLHKDKDYNLLNWDLYQEIHTDVCCGIKIPQESEMTNEMSKRSFYVEIPDEVYEELRKVKLLGCRLFGRDKTDDVLVYEQTEEDGIKKCSTNYRLSDRKPLVDAVFNEYYELISKERSEVGLLKIIANTVRTLHILHSFADGNGRLNMPVIMNMLLCREGFTPAILPDDPEVFGGLKKIDDLVKDMIIGMHDFQNEVVQAGIDLPKEYKDKLSRLKETLSQDDVSIMEGRFEYDGKILFRVEAIQKHEAIKQFISGINNFGEKSYMVCMLCTVDKEKLSCLESALKNETIRRHIDEYDGSNSELASMLISLSDMDDEKLLSFASDIKNSNSRKSIKPGTDNWVDRGYSSSDKSRV